MAAGDTTLLNGVLIAHTSGVTVAKILSYSHEMPDRVTVDASDCSTTGAKPFLAAPDYDLGTITVTVRYDSSLDPSTPLAATTATQLAITHGTTGNMTFTVDSFMISSSSSGQKDGIVDATYRWKISDTTPTW